MYSRKIVHSGHFHQKLFSIFSELCFPIDTCLLKFCSPCHAFHFTNSKLYLRKCIHPKLVSPGHFPPCFLFFHSVQKLNRSRNFFKQKLNTSPKTGARNFHLVRNTRAYTFHKLKEVFFMNRLQENVVSNSPQGQKKKAHMGFFGFAGICWKSSSLKLKFMHDETIIIPAMYIPGKKH